MNYITLFSTFDHQTPRSWSSYTRLWGCYICSLFIFSLELELEQEQEQGQGLGFARSCIFSKRVRIFVTLDLITKSRVRLARGKGITYHSGWKEPLSTSFPLLRAEEGRSGHWAVGNKPFYAFSTWSWIHRVGLLQSWLATPYSRLQLSIHYTPESTHSPNSNSLFTQRRAAFNGIHC